MVVEKITRLAGLSCSVCHKYYDANVIQRFAECESCGKSPLLAEYELHQGLDRSLIDNKNSSMWRYAELMPVSDPHHIISLGEGWTPIFSLSKTTQALAMNKLQMKDESLNPTGSFKARGMSAAVSKAKELGVEKCIVPSAGNAGVAMAAYCAQANLKAVVVMPRITPKAFINECLLYGCEVILEDGLINACAKKVAQLNQANEYFDFSTMKEPYRLEGKKTMGYEIAEQRDWKLPDVILYPTGGGTGLIGVWKAFHEMIKMGWIHSKLPRLIAVQSDSCQPVVQAFHSKVQNGHTKMNEPGSSVAYGLNVPTPFALRQIIQILHESGGTAVSVMEDEIIQNTKEIIRTEGILISPEGGALLAALKKLLATDTIKHDEDVLMLNTGSGVKYMDDLM